MTSNSRRFGVLFFSLVASIFPLSVSSWADDSDGSPRWCLKAKTKVEKLICDKDEHAGAYDQEVTIYYRTLLQMVERSTKSDLVESQKRWIAERERCGSTFKKAEDFQDLRQCVSDKTLQRSELLLKDIRGRYAEKKWSEFNKFKLKTFKNTALEFRYPSSWHLERTEDSKISLKSNSEEMILGFEKTMKSSEQCTYSEAGFPEDQIRRALVKVQIGGHEFENFNRGWIPSGEDDHYYGFFNGRCFEIDVFDNPQASVNCNRRDLGKDRANCVIAGLLELKDLMAYSNAVMRTLRFLSDQK